MTEAPRIPPLEREEWPEEVSDILDAAPEGRGSKLGEHHIFSTFARHPELFRSWLRLGGYLLWGGTLPPRDRELVILRIAVRCRCSYEWGQHVRIAEAVGIEREAIDRVVEGAGAAGWNDLEATLLRAADELHDTATLSDDTWQALAAHYEQRQLIELPMLVGQYHLVAFTLNALRVQPEEGLEPLPASAGLRSV